MITFSCLKQGDHKKSHNHRLQVMLQFKREIWTIEVYFLLYFFKLAVEKLYRMFFP